MKLAKIFIVFTFLLAFAVCISAQDNQFPNELKGYEFFGKGKLKELKLGISTKEDVERVFGESCKKPCKYNRDWNIFFKYFDFASIEKNGVKFVPKQEFYGKLYSITLTPKNRIPFQKIQFPKLFASGHGSGSGYSDKGYSSKEEKDYRDVNGLIYTICEKSFSIPCKKGDLTAIIYSIPEKLEAEMLTLKK
ncbi:MAG: hypothetical protein ACR2N3_00540 [Pyrinomonadaceae bacterium]